MLSRFRAPSASFISVADLGLGHRPIIRGESNYQPLLRSLVATGASTWTAYLVREPRNRYDSNAVAVHVNGSCIGHLAKEQAALLAGRLDELSRRGVWVRFDVELCGGDDGRANIGVFPK